MSALLGATLAVLLAAVTPAPPATPARHLVSVRDSPGYVPLVDPDSLAEKLGRRPNAKLVSEPFTGGGASLDGLARLVCRALHRDDPDSLLALCVTSSEFRTILWPEFPQSRPATGLRWEDGWSALWGRLNGGSVSATREFGGHFYTLLGVERTAATVPYKNFKLYNGITIVAKDDEGAIQRFAFIRSIAERRGRFKIYSMAD
jgi:hypothetical protein